MNSRVLSPEKDSRTAALLRRIFGQYIRPHFRALLLALFFMLIAAGMTGAMASLMEPIIDDVFKQRDQTRVVEIALAVFFVFFARGIATYFHSVIMNRIGQQIVSTLQQQLFSGLIYADLARLHARASGHLVSLLINDVSVMRYSMAECLTGIFKSSLTLLILVGVMFWQDWRLAGATFLVFPLAALFVGRVGKRLRRISAHTQEDMGAFSAFLTQSFQGIRQVKAYGMEPVENHKAEKLIVRLMNLANKAFRTGALTTPVTETLSGLAIVTVLLYGGTQVIAGAQTPGALFSFITAFLLAYEPMKRLGKLNGQLQMGLAAAERVFVSIDTPPQVLDRADAAPLPVGKYDIEFQSVVFRYAPEAPPAIDGISLQVPEGKTVALVGASGSGKSTILNLLLRFYDVEQGKITIGGKDISTVTQESLRNHIALVSQDSFLFDDTIRANIAYGAKDASREQIEAAAQAANAHAFIRQLPLGYDTPVGEHGVKLSGGQRQRIAIARAMLRDAPILLLDEATSALDSESERLVQEALRRLSFGRTTIVVAHRLSTIVDADQIFVLESGKLLEHGTHQELLGRDGAYRRLYGRAAGEEAGA